MEHTHTILIIDDEPAGRDTLEMVLFTEGYRLEFAANGPEAIEQVGRLDPDVILLDVMMPGMDGFEVCQQLRMHPRHAEVPIIMVTALDDRNSRLRGVEAGADDFVSKPFDRIELRTRVRSITRLNRYRRLLREREALLQSQEQLIKTNIAYSRFVPRELLQHLGKDNIIDMRLGDCVQQEMTVLFADIRSFTSLLEHISPHKAFQFLNSYLRRMSPIIRDHGGFIDKYIGDAIMAIFPHRPDDALNAAIEVLAMAGDYSSQREARGEAALRVAIGVHTGSVMLGTIGSEEQMAGTVVSDAVNLAARLVDVAGLYNVGIVTSEQTIARLAEPAAYRYRALGRVRVRGKREIIAVSELFDNANRHRDGVAAFEHALELYYQKDFAQALVHFNQALALLPNDTATHLYLQRVARLVAHGVRDNWDGVEDSNA